MKKAEADQLMKDLDKSDGSAREYGRYLAAIGIRAGEKELRRRNGKGKASTTLGKALKNQTAHYSFLRNHALYRGTLTPRQRAEQAIGTTGNESLHHELQGWGRSINRQKRRLLVAKVAVFQFSKLARSVLRLHHSSAQEGPEIVSCVAARVFRCGEAIKLRVLGAAEAAKERQEEREAAAREKELRKADRELKDRAAAKRGVENPGKNRSAIRPFREARRERGVKTRAAGPRAKQWLAEAAKKPKAAAKAAKNRAKNAKRSAAPKRAAAPPHLPTARGRIGNGSGRGGDPGSAPAADTTGAASGASGAAGSSSGAPGGEAARSGGASDHGSGGGLAGGASASGAGQSSGPAGGAPSGPGGAKKRGRPRKDPSARAGASGAPKSKGGRPRKDGADSPATRQRKSRANREEAGNRGGRPRTGAVDSPRTRQRKHRAAKAKAKTKAGPKPKQKPAMKKGGKR